MFDLIYETLLGLNIPDINMKKKSLVTLAILAGSHQSNLTNTVNGVLVFG